MENARGVTAPPPQVIYHSRADCDKRHVRYEEALFTALTARFSGRIDVLPWQGGASPDVERAARDWSRAALVVGPHGAGLANMIHCLPGTTVLVLPAADGGGLCRNQPLLWVIPTKLRFGRFLDETTALVEFSSTKLSNTLVGLKI